MTESRKFASLLFAAACLLAATGRLHAAAASTDLRPDIQHLFDGGHYQDAVNALQPEALEEPQNASVQFWLGRSFYELRDYARSISSFERATAIESNNSEFHDWLGKACGRKAEETGRLSAFSALALARRTHREFETAVQLDRRNLEAQRDLIRFLLNAPGILGGGEERALQQIADLALVDSTEGDLARAEFFAVKKDFDRAGQQYQEILQSKPKRLGICLEAAEYYRDRGDGTGMQHAVDEATMLAPSDRLLEYYRGVARVLTKQDAPDAEKDLRAYLDNVPDSSEAPPHASAHEWLGRLYEDQKLNERAAAEYKAAIALDPRDKDLRDDLKRVEK